VYMTVMADGGSFVVYDSMADWLAIRETLIWIFTQ